MIGRILGILGVKEFQYRLKRNRLLKSSSCDLASAQAWENLKNFSPNPQTSCIDKKQLGTKYDLGIIIPAYNVEKYIKQCMDSVLNQKTDYTYHVTVINDGSKDHTGQILEEYQENSKVTVVHQENRGFSGARNAGIHRANGKYLMFVDSDDFIPDGTIQALLSSAMQNDADIVEGGVLACTEIGRKYRVSHSHKTSGISSLPEMSGYPFCKVYKKYLFEEISFPEHYWYEDSIMRQIIYPKAKRIFAITENVYCRRDNPAGITNTGVKKKKSIDSLYITLSLYNDRRTLGIKTDQNYYEYILRMARLTYLRIRFQPKKIRQSAFIVFCDFIQEEFSEYQTKLYPDLEYALRNRNYALYEAWCEK